MSIFVTKCPHCKTNTIGLKVVSGSIVRQRKNGVAQPDQLGVHLECPNCDLPVCAVFVASIPENRISDYFKVAAQTALKESRDITHYGFKLDALWPFVPKPRIPEHLEPDASRALLQAERNFEIAGNEEAAAIMYRRALEISLKKAFPGGPDNLSKLIKKLVTDGKLTPAIGEWADHIREIGNDAAHETGPLSRKDLSAMREFTDAVLRYAISLPAEIEARRASTLPDVPVELAALAKPA